MEKEPRAEKVAVVEEVKGLLAESSAAFITEYRGMSVKGIAELRNQLRPANTQIQDLQKHSCTPMPLTTPESVVSTKCLWVQLRSRLSKVTSQP